MVGVSLSLGMVLLAGAAVGGYMLLKDKVPGTAPAPATTPAAPTPSTPAPTTVPIGNGVVVPVGSNTSWDTQQKQLEQARLEADRQASADAARRLAEAQAEVARQIEQQKAEAARLAAERAEAARRAAEEAARLAEQERLREIEWRKRDTINLLERDWSGCINEIKRTTDQLNVIDQTPMPPDIIAEVLRQRRDQCMNSRPWWWVAPDYDCRWVTNLEGDDGKWQKIADDMWKARQDLQRRPLLVRLGELGAQQQSLLQNLAALGVIKQPVNVRTA